MRAGRPGTPSSSSCDAATKDSAEPILLAEQFARDVGFEELGGVRYLADLVDRAPPAANAPDYARAMSDGKMLITMVA